MRIMKLRRPRQPTHFAGAVVILIQRLKQTEAFQSLSAFFDKGVKCRPLLFGGFASVVFKRIKRLLQSIALERPNRRISDGFRNPQRRNALADIRLLEPVFQLFVVGKRADLLHIQINRIEPFARRRAVRAGKSRLGAEKRVQRIDADKIQLLIRRERHQIQQIGKIPDAPVPLRTQTVQMRRQPVHPQTAFQHLRLINRLRRNHQPHLADNAFYFCKQCVITASQSRQRHPKHTVFAMVQRQNLPPARFIFQANFSRAMKLSRQLQRFPTIFMRDQSIRIKVV